MDNSSQTRQHSTAGIELLPDPGTCERCAQLLKDQTGIVETGREISNDAALLIEVLAQANTTENKQSAAQLLAVESAVSALGNETLSVIIEQTKSRAALTDEKLASCYLKLIEKSRLAGSVAAIIADHLDRNCKADAFAAAVMLYIPDMLALLKLKNRYVDLTQKLSVRSKVNACLSGDLNFNPDRVFQEFMQHKTLPGSICALFDREKVAPTPEAGVLRAIAYAGAEMLDAHAAGKLEDLAPGKKISAKSWVRIVGLDETEYRSAYNEISEHLGKGPVPISAAPQCKPLPARTEAAPQAAPALSNEPDVAPNMEIESDSPVIIVSGSESDAPERIAPPEMRAGPGQVADSVIGAVLELCVRAETSDKLLTSVLNYLVDQGPFSRAALLVTNYETKSALALVVCGEQGFSEDSLTLDLNDPESPLAKPVLKVESYGINRSKSAPFDAKAYALAPIDIANSSPVVLYADCGNTSTLPFEARRIFRRVVEMLNDILPELPGSLPKELESPHAAAT